jgi:predicted flavoprotein YhiN
MRDQAYAAVGRYVLEHCDVLIAIWDGQSAQGLGGTGDIVAQARQRGLPMAWIHAGNHRPGTEEPTTLGEEQGKVSLERFPDRAPE